MQEWRSKQMQPQVVVPNYARRNAYGFLTDNLDTPARRQSVEGNLTDPMHFTDIDKELFVLRYLTARANPPAPALTVDWTSNFVLERRTTHFELAHPNQFTVYDNAGDVLGKVALR